MKLWRGVTLTIWTVLLAGCAAFILSYHALSTTVLDVSKTKSLLAQSGTYEILRDTVLVDLVDNAITARYPEAKLIDKSMIRQVIADVLPATTVRDRLDPALTNIYRWLDSKEEDITFSISVVDKKDSFYRALESRIGEKITSLESCGDYRYPPEDAILQDMCLPIYVSAKEATQAVMGSIRAGDFPLGEIITQDSLLGAKAERGAFNELPTWLNILWSLNLLALAIFLVLAIFLLITRKSLGLIAVGVSLIVAGTVVSIVVPILSGLQASIPRTAPLATSVVDALRPALSSALIHYALIAILAGVVTATITIIWRSKAERGSRA